jgi:hypothetical protein
MERPRGQSAVTALITAAAAIALLGIGTAQAASPADKCEASELKTSGKYAFCRLKEESKAAKTGGMPDFSTCDTTFSTKFGNANTQGMGACPSSATQAQIQTFITQCTDGVATALGGGALPMCPPPPPPPPLKTGQTTAYGTGSDGDLQKGASQSFTDNGDGTITDNTTGLMWEKKDQSGLVPHAWNQTYTWCGASCGITNIMDGTITTTFLAVLNGGSGFAGHTDWRIPNANELESIRNLENVTPATDSAFNTGCVASCTVTMCSCTESLNYWSSTTYQTNPLSAWSVGFDVGALHTLLKSSIGFARAVRGGS